MKIIKRFMGIILCCLVLTITVNASEIGQNTYEFIEPEMTVQFSSDTEFSEQKKYEIACSFAGVCNSHIPGDSINNIICSLFGHNLSTSMISVTTHKVHIRDPRCQLDIYDVTGCSRCDYIEQVLVSSGRISCHPEELPLPEGTNPTE